MNKSLMDKLVFLFASIGFIGMVGALIILYGLEGQLKQFQRAHQQWIIEQEEVTQLQRKVLQNQAVLKKLCR